MIGVGQWDEFHFFQPIGLPYIIHLLQKFFGDWTEPLAILQAITSTITLYLIWKVSCESWGKKVANWALLVGTFHIPWIIFNGFGLSESLYTFGLSVLLYVSYRLVKRSSQSTNWGYTWGLVFMLTFLIKGNHAFYGPLFILSLILVYRSISTLRSILAMGIVVGAGLILHGTLAYKTTGKFLMTPTAGGLNFVEGKCPNKRNIDSRGILWVSPLYVQLGIQTEKHWPEPFNNSSYFMREGVKCIKENPLVLIQSIEGIFFLFMGNYLWPVSELEFSPFVRLYELIFAFFVLPGLIVYGVQLWKTKNSEEFLVWVVPIISIFLCVYIFKSEIRFRMPFDIFFIPVAVRGWVYLISTRERQHQSSLVVPELMEKTDP